MNQTNFDVIVVGGGFAGLTAARDLAHQGRQVLVLEASDRLGGRTESRVIQLGGSDVVAEFGGQWVNPNYHLNIGAELKHYDLDVIAFPDSHQWPVYVAGQHLPGPLPVPMEEVYGLEELCFQLMRDSRRLTVGIPLDRQNVTDLDISYEAYLDKMNLPPATRGFATFFSGLYGGAYAERLSALQVLYMIALKGSPLRIWNSLSYTIPRGTGAVIDAIAADITRGQIRLSTPIASVQQDERKVTVTTDSGGVFTAPAAVVAVPVACWNDIDFSPALHEAKQDSSARKQGARALKIWAHVKNAPTHVYKVADPDLTNGLFLAVTERDLGDEGQVIIALSMRDITDDARPYTENSFSSVEESLQLMFPGAELVAYEAKDYCEEKYSGYVDWMAPQPGVLTSSSSHLSEPEGRLFFATADISHGFHGYIDGAVETGKRAATHATLLLEREGALVPSPTA